MSMTNTRHHLRLTQILILGIICISVITVTIFTIFTLSHRPKSIDIESEISTLASNYYETYYFPKLESSILNHSNSTLPEVLSNYTSTGFSKVPLRQILAHTSPSPNILNYISQHCDTDTTLIHYFPEPPFTSTSYYTKYSYSCNL